MMDRGTQARGPPDSLGLGLETEPQLSSSPGPTPEPAEAKMPDTRQATAYPARSRWRSVTPLLAFSCFCLLVGDMLFGYDTASFGGILGNPGFINQFGRVDATTGKRRISPLHTSLLSSLAFIGKLLGCAVSGPLIERLGHRKVFWVLSAVSCVGIIIELTAADQGVGSGRLAQFIVGRIVVYISIGLVEVCVTTYQSEIVPSALRGLVISSLQLFLNAGGLVATGVNRRYSTDHGHVGWKIVTGLQFIYPVLISFFVFFIPESPRWLLSRDRDHDALASLVRLRPKADAASGACEHELAQIKDSLDRKVHKTSWLSCFRGTNLWRTTLVVVYYTYQQITGQAFVSTYQTVFYLNNGYAPYAFTYPVINAVLSVFAVLPCMWFTDTLGRRAVLLSSFTLQGLWLFLLAGIGSKANKTTTERSAVVAFFMLFNISFNLGGAPVPYLLGAELPNHSVREKTQTIGTSINVVFAFVTNFVLPYMLAALSFKVGWIFGGIAFSASLFTLFFLPETKNLRLEQIDAVFHVPFRLFRRSGSTNDATGEHTRTARENDGGNMNADAMNDGEKLSIV